MITLNTGTPFIQMTTPSEAPVRPFGQVTVSDSDTLSIIVRSGGGGTPAGTLSGTGVSGFSTVYSLSGTPAAITSELEALFFTPFAGAPNTTTTTTFTLSDQSGDTTTPVAVADFDPPVAPTIAGTVSGQTTASEVPVWPGFG
jgi:hypothetical protein